MRQHQLYLTKFMVIYSVLIYAYIKQAPNFSRGKIEPEEYKKLSELDRNLTENNFTYQFTPSTLTCETFLKNAKKSSEILIVSAGWGTMVLMALQINVRLKVSVNPISEEHSQTFLAHLNPNEKKRLTLFKESIFKTPLDKNKYDAVLIKNFLQNLSGDEIDQLLEKIHTTLKPGGKVYIITPSPYIKIFDRAKLLPIINHRGTYDRWHGHFIDFQYLVSCKFPNLATKVPNKIHTLTIEQLKESLEKKSFSVEKIEYHHATTIENTDHKELLILDGREYTCAIGKKL